MEFVCLFSGGKDSVLSLIVAESYSHKCIGLCHIAPFVEPEGGVGVSDGIDTTTVPNNTHNNPSIDNNSTCQSITSSATNLTTNTSTPFSTNTSSTNNNTTSTTDMNSFMYQSVCSNMIISLSSCIGLPLFIRYSKQTTSDKTLHYTKSSSTSDEVEDLYILLRDIKTRYPTLKAVSTGAIFSTYQRSRVESVATRLNLTVLSYLWQVPQIEVMGKVAEHGIQANIAKVQSAGLDSTSLWKTTTFMMDDFLKLESKFGFNVAGEGGEYETLVTDCPRYTFGSLSVTDLKVQNEDGGEGAYVKVEKWEIVWKVGKKVRERLGIEQGDVWVSDGKGGYRVDKEGRRVGGGEEEEMETLEGGMGSMEGWGRDIMETTPPKPPTPPTTNTQTPAKTPSYTLHEGGLLSVSKICPPPPPPGSSSTVVSELLSILSSLSCLLKSLNMTPQDVVSSHLYLTDITDFQDLNVYYKRFFGTVLPPSRSCVGTGVGLNDWGAKVSIDIIAQKGSGRYNRGEDEGVFEHYR